jgi:hypothetical protein
MSYVGGHADEGVRELPALRREGGAAALWTGRAPVGAAPDVGLVLSESASKLALGAAAVNRCRGRRPCARRRPPTRRRRLADWTSTADRPTGLRPLEVRTHYRERSPISHFDWSRDGVPPSGRIPAARRFELALEQRPTVRRSTALSTGGTPQSPDALRMCELRLPVPDVDVLHERGTGVAARRMNARRSGSNDQANRLDGGCQTPGYGAVASSRVLTHREYSLLALPLRTGPLSALGCRSRPLRSP